MSKPKHATPNTDDIRNFFVWSDRLDRDVLRLLEHIKPNWELDWDAENRRYAPEEDSFATDLNLMIEDIAITAPSERYHDSEDILAEYVTERLKWPIRKERGRWVGADYDVILEQGAFDDVDQAELLTAATGRIYAAFAFGQKHYDDLEESHRRMLAAILSIILYHRAN